MDNRSRGFNSFRDQMPCLDVIPSNCPKPPGISPGYYAECDTDTDGDTATIESDLPHRENLFEQYQKQLVQQS